MLLLIMALASDTTHAIRVPIAPGESLQVVTAGAGEPVVLIPGLIGSAFSYRSVINLLVATGYRAMVVEPLGIGGSSRPKDADYSLTAQADRIAVALDSLRIDSAVVVAHSIGASIALRLAYRHPARVRALISLEGGPAEAATSRGFRRAMALTPLLKLLNGEKLIRGRVRSDLVAASADSSWITEAVIDGYTADAVADYFATLDAFRAMAESTEPERLADHLPGVRIPVLLLVGRSYHESAPAAEEVALFAERLPAFEVDSIARTGHFIHEERPDVVLTAVMRFTQEPRPCVAALPDSAARPATGPINGTDSSTRSLRADCRAPSIPEGQ